MSLQTQGFLKYLQDLCMGYVWLKITVYVSSEKIYQNSPKWHFSAHFDTYSVRIAIKPQTKTFLGRQIRWYLDLKCLSWGLCSKVKVNLREKIIFLHKFEFFYPKFIHNDNGWIKGLPELCSLPTNSKFLTLTLNVPVWGHVPRSRSNWGKKLFFFT